MPKERGPALGMTAVMTLGMTALIAAAAPWRTPEAPVADAAMRHDTAEVRALIKQGADVNAAQGDGMTALHWAAETGDANEAKMLILAGARVDAVTRDGNYTPLHVAAKTGHAAVVKALLDGGADFKAATSSGGTTALHFAAAQGNTESIAALLDKGGGALIDAREHAFEQTPLMWAAAAGRVDAVRLLTKRGADVKLISAVRDVTKQDSIDRAAVALRTRRLAALKAAEQPLAGRGTRQAASGGTADSASQGRGRGRGGTQDDSTRNRVINRGPSFSELVGRRGGLTPLLFAVREGNTDCVKALLDAGADVNEVSGGDHSSPLLLATINGQFDLAMYLLDRGADPKLANDAGATPLYTTINVQWAPKSLYPQPVAQQQQKTTHLELMEALIKKGADVNVRLKKHLWFMSYNFDLLGVNTTGATPFWRAAYGLDVPAMKLLIKYGADQTIPTMKPEGALPGADPPAETDSVKTDPSGLPPVPKGGPGVYPIHAASGAGYGEGFAANSHQHAPDAWLPAVKYLVEELHADVNARDFKGYSPLHDAAARGDNQLIEYLISKGADIHALSRTGQTVADMANGPVQRVPPFPATVALLEKLGSKNSHKCKSC